MDEATRFLLIMLVAVSMIPLVVWPFSRISGCWQLSQLRSSSETDEAPLTEIGFQHCEFRYLIGYNGCTTFRVYESCLVIRIWPFLHMGHPPIVLPWSELQLQACESKLRRRQTRIVNSAMPEIPIFISARTACRLKHVATDFDVKAALAAAATIELET